MLGLHHCWELCSAVPTGHHGVQEKAEAPEDPHAGWDSENSDGG